MRANKYASYYVSLALSLSKNTRVNFIYPEEQYLLLNYNEASRYLKKIASDYEVGSTGMNRAKFTLKMHEKAVLEGYDNHNLNYIKTIQHGNRSSSDDFSKNSSCR